MELLGIIISIPAAFIAGIIYLFLLNKLIAKLPLIIMPLIFVSVFILSIVLLELCCTVVFGVLNLKEIIGQLYYQIHIAIFFLTLPALVTLLRLQNRFVFLSKWYSIGIACAVIGLFIVLQQYIVSEALFGVDGMGELYRKP